MSDPKLLHAIAHIKSQLLVDAPTRPGHWETRFFTEDYDAVKVVVEALENITKNSGAYSCTGLPPKLYP